MCCCCGCCVNNEPISKRPPPNAAGSGKDSITQQPTGSKKGNETVAGSTEQKTKKDSDCGNYENVSIMK
ncbi:hypothetical protein PRIPAC_71331 [Pristionchus pacificus]|uniref:Uncharacterized protein n=1 Tax=Pristionchus pacificus TaxID=54126 RepID=A0A2A6BF08_PRIPA|nr:hypothetical protein PRIPAC_71331 [Pristionchus pacificus]|eukprot:PDM64469.1 hypothetical protein PRIPAC_52725 [Pristionchus pacificus]